MMRARIVTTAMLVGLLGACSDSEKAPEGTLTVHGTVTSKLAVDNARVVAIGADGRRFWAYLDMDRDFTLELPVGQSYRVVVANQNVGGGQTVIGRVMLPTEKGSTPWIGANDQGSVDLGRLRVSTSTLTGLNSGVKPACSACGSGGSSGSSGSSADDDDEDEDKESGGSYGGGSSSHDDDKECKSGGDEDDDDDDDDDDSDDDDKGGGGGSYGGGGGSGGGGGDGSGYGGGAGDDDDDAEKCDVCTAGEAEEVDLEPSKPPGKKCEDKGGKKKPAYKDQKPCSQKPKKPSQPSGGGAYGGGNSGGGETPKPPSEPSDEGAPEATPSAPNGGGGAYGGGNKSPGSTCEQSAQCTSTCACVASTCEVK